MKKLIVVLLAVAVAASLGSVIFLNFFSGDATSNKDNKKNTLPDNTDTKLTEVSQSTKDKNEDALAEENTEDENEALKGAENHKEVIETDASTSAQRVVYQTSKGIKNKVIVVDAGHGISSYNKQEPIAPNSSETKAAFASGTAGVNQSEEQLNLLVALRLQEALTQMGAVVHMTRTEHTTDMTNVDRAVFANDLNADISVKIHADGSNNKDVHGISVLVPGNAYISDDRVIQQSNKAGTLLLDEIVKTTGAKKNGVSVRNDLTGFNWSTVPVVLLEMGFMTNPNEDRLMETEDYREKIVAGIVAGLERYFSNN